MQRLNLIFLLALLLLSGCRASKTQVTMPSSVDPVKDSVINTVSEATEPVWDFRDATTWILGDFSPDRFNYQPHSSWYFKGFAEYVPDQQIMSDLGTADIETLTITIVLGTWCPDSRREVPRFMKIADMWGFPQEKIRFIGVDINKVAPLADFGQMRIERVPTFIFYKNNIEAGRIIEVPLTSLEQDMRDILRR